MTEPKSRRAFLRDAGIGALAFCVGGQQLWLTPAEARERDVALRKLNAREVSALDAFAETLLPGSAKAGVAHFIDHQLAAPAEEQLLVIKYLGVERPFGAFYAAGLAALDASAKAAHGISFAELDSKARTALTAEVASSHPAGWDGPPPPLFYFVLRNDALDVVYGTVKGVESLGLPYMAHITPPSRWGET